MAPDPTLAIAAMILTVINAVVSALVARGISRAVLKENVARELLSEALSVQALEEAWILQGAKTPIKLSDQRDLEEKEPSDHPITMWLRRVEVRAVLDEAKWNSPTREPYGIIETRRAWIVRDEVGPERYSGPTILHYPALISSKAREELCGWIERVRRAHARWPFLRTLRDSDLEMLRPLLLQLARDDVADILSPGLTNESVEFLKQIRERWPMHMQQ